MPTTCQWLGIVPGIQAPGAGGSLGIGTQGRHHLLCPLPFPHVTSVESVMGHWISEPTGTTDRKLGGSQALDSTGICLCQRSETGQAFRDVDLGGRVVSRATRHPTPLPVLGNLQNYPCFLEARVPRVVNWGVWGLPRPGPVQFYLDPRIL